MNIPSDATEAVKHRRYVELLAEESNRPVEDVESIYSDVLHNLRATAGVPDFIPVFAWRRTRALILHR